VNAPHAGVFFDALFNLNKFIQFEQRDPFGDRQKREDPFDNDWDRFAYRDYQQLALDEEENEG
jgi:serine/threonine-protein phosphatase 2A regulatory subunit B''